VACKVLPRGLDAGLHLEMSDRDSPQDVPLALSLLTPRVKEVWSGGLIGLGPIERLSTTGRPVMYTDPD
jgi:hypothetical protein